MGVLETLRAKRVAREVEARQSGRPWQRCDGVGVGGVGVSKGLAEDVWEEAWEEA